VSGTLQRNKSEKAVWGIRNTAFYREFFALAARAGL